MRAYSATDEEAVRARDLLKDWAGEGFLTKAQYEQMEPETACALRRTNVFLRIVLFLFTVLIVVAAVALFFSSGPTSDAVVLLIFAAVAYAGAELAVSQARLYRFGIEEALAACSVGLLCAGIVSATRPASQDLLAPAGSALVSLWIWHRFGFAYAFPAAMLFVAWFADESTQSHTAQHVIAAAIYAAGLIAIAILRPRYRLTYLKDNHSIAEAFLWLGIYLAINLKLSTSDILLEWRGGFRTADEFARPFYWATWVLTWCLPPVVLVRGVRLRDRFVIAVGVVVAILTLATNKPYLGWTRHTWDPMLLGALLIGVALFIRRWLAAGPDEIRHGFTARRLSGKDKRWLNAGITVAGLASTNVIAPKASSPEVRFGGGQSGGGGASSDF